MKTFNPSSDHPARAVQAWQILISKAANRQTVTYEGLSETMYRKPAAGVLAGILGHIAFYCKEQDIPPLTALVVVKGEGKPGQKIPVPLTEIDDEREKVYKYDWYNLYPPNEAEFTSAYKKHHKVAP